MAEDCLRRKKSPERPAGQSTASAEHRFGRGPLQAVYTRAVVCPAPSKMDGVTAHALKGGNQRASCEQCVAGVFAGARAGAVCQMCFMSACAGEKLDMASVYHKCLCRDRVGTASARVGTVVGTVVIYVGTVHRFERTNSFVNSSTS